MKNRPFSSYGTLLAGLVFGAGSLAAVQRASAPSPSPRRPAPAATVRPLLTPARQAGTAPAPAASAVQTRTASLEDLRRLNSQFADLAAYVAPAVVRIRAEGRPAAGANPLSGLQTGGEGSGFVYRPDGVIVTNDHVVGGFDNVTVEFKDGREFRGKVTRAPEADIAIVRIEAKGLPALKIADSSKVRPGEFAIAVGAPLGLQNSVTIGNVSAIGRASAIPDANLPSRGRFYPDLIQTDAAINPGNSGGPLVDINGDVIGVATGIYSLTGGSNGLGFAIPGNQVRLVADLLAKDGKLVRSQLGVIPEDVKEYRRAELGIPGGALVAEVSNGSPAEKAGVRKDDVILRVADQTVLGQMDVRNAMLRYRPGTAVDVELLRGKERRTVKVTLAEAPPVATAPPATEAPSDPTLPDGATPDGSGRFERLRKQMEDLLKGREGDLGNLVPPLGSPPNAPAPRPLAAPPRLGVSLSPGGRDGAVVASVDANSLADRTGLRAGDRIVAFDGKPIRNGAQLAAAMAGVKRGQTHRFRIVRGGSTVERTVAFR